MKNKNEIFSMLILLEKFVHIFAYLHMFLFTNLYENLCGDRFWPGKYFTKKKYDDSTLGSSVIAI